MVLVGATTENPSFELNAALLSRARVLVFHSLDAGGDREAARARRGRSRAAAAARRGGARRAGAHGRRRRPRGADARRGGLARRPRRAKSSTPSSCRRSLQRRAPIYDKSQDGHYNLISALHKSVRGSDPDAALYYLCAHAGCRRGPAVPGAARGAHGGRGYRARRSAGAGDRQRRQGRL